MKGYFVLFGQSAEDDKSGIGLKVRNQIKAFNNSGLNCKELVLPISKNKLLPILYRMPFFNVYPVWKYMSEFDEADYLYMRRPFVMNYHMRKILKIIRKKNPAIKVIVEIPTYPYDAEYETYKAKRLLILKDKYNRTKMKGLINFYAILTDEKEVFGIPAIKIENGIDVSAVNKRQPFESLPDDDSIHICAVAMFKEWHGYERFIEGLNKYYLSKGSRNIICHFVGEGSELPYYKRLVKKYALESHFVFHGFLEQDALDAVYNLSTIALSSLGSYKKNINYSCDLKSREAVARGIPVVTGCPTDIFLEGKYKYYLEFPNDPTDLDIQKIIDFHDSIYSERQTDVVNKIRKYAFDNINIDKCMKNVIHYFKS